MKDLEADLTDMMQYIEGSQSSDAERTYDHLEAARQGARNGRLKEVNQHLSSASSVAYNAHGASRVSDIHKDLKDLVREVDQMYREESDECWDLEGDIRELEDLREGMLISNEPGSTVHKVLAVDPGEEEFTIRVEWSPPGTYDKVGEVTTYKGSYVTKFMEVERNERGFCFR